MIPVSRRGFLAGVGAAGLLPLTPSATGSAAAAAAAAPGAFAHGVASGDPLPDAVILWTRVTPAQSQTGAIRVDWRVATDPAFDEVVAAGTAEATATSDWTVKVDVTGLRPGSAYYFAFEALDTSSPVGRTRTALAGSPERLRLAVVTCGDFSRGLFNAYRRVAARDDIDAVVHLGDYIYETARRDDRVRPHEPPEELRALDDYRGRYASYRSDPALAELHARHPMIWVWDDHETSNGTWMNGASGHDAAEDGPFADRKAAARQAALEWMPIRSPEPGNPERIYRRFAFGDLVDLFMLDTRRIGRDEQVPPNGPGEFFQQRGAYADPSRQLLGTAQEDWLRNGLGASTAAWRLLGNQVVFSPLKIVGAPEATRASVFANPDQWDGYAPARDKIYDTLQSPDVSDVVVLTGDVHASLAFEVTRDPNNPAVYDPLSGRGIVAVEFVTPSISSAGDARTPDDADTLIERLVLEGDQALRVPNPHLKYIKAQLNGYLIIDVDRERLRAEFWLVPTVTRPSDEEYVDQVFIVPRGDTRLVDAGPGPGMPEPVVPDVPVVALLPLAGLAAGGAVVAAARARATRPETG